LFIDYSAAINLKNYIETYWSPSNNKFVGPEPNFEVRQFESYYRFNPYFNPYYNLLLNFR